MNGEGVVVSWNTTIARGKDDAPCVNVATAGWRRLRRTPVLFVALYARKASGCFRYVLLISVSIISSVPA